MTTKSEIWRRVRTNPEYQISSLGRVKGLRGQLMKPYEMKAGYFVVNFRGKWCYVHKLIAESFIPNPRGVRYVNHKDGNKKNHTITNLEWVTKSEDRLHALRTGLAPKARGDKHHYHKLTEKQVRRMFRLAQKEGAVLAQIARVFGVGPTIVNDIVHGRKWKSLKLLS